MVAECGRNFLANHQDNRSPKKEKAKCGIIRIESRSKFVYAFFLRTQRGCKPIFA